MEESRKARYILKKQFPGMRLKVGTIFCSYQGWGDILGTSDGMFDNHWVPSEFFEPFVGEFFEKV